MAEESSDKLERGGGRRRDQSTEECSWPGQSSALKNLRK